jgi:hypothetical protein
LVIIMDYCVKLCDGFYFWFPNNAYLIVDLKNLNFVIGNLNSTFQLTKKIVLSYFFIVNKIPNDESILTYFNKDFFIVV